MIKYYWAKTQKDLEYLMEELQLKGYKWANGNVPTKHDGCNWGFFQENTVVEANSETLKIHLYNRNYYKKEEGITDFIEYNFYNLPDHYKISDIDTMEFILAVAEHNNCTQKETFYLCNTLKYLVRYGNKNGIKDLKKAKDYLNRLIDEVEK